MRREIPVTQARADLAELVNRVAYSGERLVLTRHGKAMAALVPADDLERLEQIARQLIHLTEVGHEESGTGQPEAQPLQIAAEYRPGGPPRPPGFH
ncbi:MAG TPA: type II toxin-antitoxin system Phd/YefM family antitoxin [Streptosporangiaceae bacterium]|jgi:prevent-host-death family protein